MKKLVFPEIITTCFYFFFKPLASVSHYGFIVGSGTYAGGVDAEINGCGERESTILISIHLKFLSLVTGNLRWLSGANLMIETRLS